MEKRRLWKLSSTVRLCRVALLQVEWRLGWEDLFSGRIVGWAVDDHMETSLCMRALEMATVSRQAAPGLIHHSDRGTQYTSKEYQAALTSRGFLSSMSRRAQCWDNAAAESLFGRIKEELFPMRRWETRAEATAAIGDFIEKYYNTRRIKLRLGSFSPVEYELHCGMMSSAA